MSYEDLLAEAQATIRWRKDGVPARGQSPLVRVLGRCVRTEAGCWEYQGHRYGDGYGFARYRGAMRGTHRIVMTEISGPIADGIVVCHSCDNPPCCNPAHLWLGTVAENNRDRERKGRSSANLIPGAGSAATASMTHCRNGGHEYTPENTRIDRRGYRRCRECQRAAAKRQWARIKGQVAA